VSEFVIELFLSREDALGAARRAGLAFERVAVTVAEGPA
jgi:hypothetical protein